MQVFEKRLSIVYAERVRLSARETAALALLHPADRENAMQSAYVNADDTMVERGGATRHATFAWRKAYVATLEMLADCAPDYGYRRA